MSKKKEKGINPELEKAINKLMQEVMSDQTATIVDKMRVIDRGFKARSSQDEG